MTEEEISGLMELLKWVAAICLPMLGLMWLLEGAKRKAKRKYKETAFFSGSFNHLSGLNLPEYAHCQVVYLESRIVIEGGGQEFSLPVEKLVDVSFMGKAEIQKQHIPKVGGAVAGGMMLGPVGALIGSGTKQKMTWNASQFLVFTYVPNVENKAEVQHIIFDASGVGGEARELARHFKYLKHKAKIQVNL